MKKIKTSVLKITLTLLGLMIVMSCASGYLEISPEAVNYNSYSMTDSVSLEYKYTSLPKKYSKKEEQYNIRLVSVKIKNNSGRDLKFGSDMTLAYSNGSLVKLIDHKTATHYLSQQSGAYFLYLLLTPLKLTSGSGTTVQETPIGFVLGPAISLVNFFTASSANKKLRNELETYSILGKTIPNGGTLDGIVAIRTRSYDALKLHVN